MTRRLMDIHIYCRSRNVRGGFNFVYFVGTLFCLPLYLLLAFINVQMPLVQHRITQVNIRERRYVTTILTSCVTIFVRVVPAIIVTVALSPGRNTPISVMTIKIASF